jgi:hypothetical protein
MSKPSSFDGYDKIVTENCERVLVTLLRGLGPWKDSVYLIGGLTPRYLVPDRPPDVPPHAGTGDVDIVVKLQMLTETEAYHTLEENFKKMGFERAENDNGQKLSWRWQIRSDSGATMILELLADDPEILGGRVQALPTDGNISALNIPHSSMVFDHHESKEVTAELLGENGVATETIKYADLVSFTCLKALAFDQRNERKDAHDLVYCIEHATGGLVEVVEVFRMAREEKHSAVIDESLSILKNRFADDDETEGYRKDGPVSVAKFELGEGNDQQLRESRALRQRSVSNLIDQLLKELAN